MNIGDLFLQLLADGSKLTPSVVKEAEKAGDAGAKTIGQRMSVGLRTAGVKAFGVAASGAFAIATKGALELENAQAEIQAQTGLNAEQAKQVALSANRIAGENRANLEDVRNIAIAVHNDLGLVGEDADKMTAKIAQFARVTHQDGVGAVTALDDITDAWSLSTEQQATVMDKLLVSQQRYGGSITGNAEALGKLAPQLLALNASFDDGVGLLNLFAASGIDASKAGAALNKAVAKLKPGQDLNDLIAQVSAIEDPTLRAQKAIEIFGAKGGTALANALKPGVDSLDDFAISAEDAAGATAEAADAIDSTFSGRVQKAISIATANLREFGAAFGPALTGAASLVSLLSAVVPAGVGGKIAGTIGKGILSAKNGIGWAIETAVEGVTSSPRMQAAGSKIGSFLGTKIGAAVALVVADQAGRFITGETSKIWSDQIGQLVAKGSLEGLQAAQIAAKSRLAALPFWTTIFDAGGIRAAAQKDADEVDRAIAEVTANAAKTISDKVPPLGEHAAAELAGGIEDGAPLVGQAIDGMADDARAAAAARFKGFHAVGAAIPEAISDGLRSRRQRVGDAFDQLMDDMKHFLGRGEMIGRDIGYLTGQKLQEALHDRRAHVREEARQFQADTYDELAKLIAGGGKVGAKAMEELRDKMHSKNPRVRKVAQETYNIVTQKLDQIPPKAGAAGTKTANAFFNSLENASKGRSFNFDVAVTATGTTKGGKAIGGPVKAGTPYWVNEDTPRSELFVPSTGGHVLTHTAAMQALSQSGGGGGGATIVNMPVSGALPVRTISDISGEMQRIDDSGLLPEDRIAPRYRRRETAGSGARL